MITIKISTADNFPLLRQLPSDHPEFKDIRFVYNEAIDECDYWIVFDKLPKEEACVCAPENIFFIAGEPPTVKHYRKDFLKQFAKVISCDASINHKGLIVSHPFLPWLAGVTYDKSIKGFRNDKFWSYDDFKLGQFAEKSKLVSVITSNKTLTRGHRKRLDFVFKLKEVLGDKLDIYGSGFNDIPDKMDALKDYKYSIVIENSQHPHYWTEKIADAYLCETFPIYFGCQNIDSYFDVDSFMNLDIHDVNQTMKVLLQLFESNIQSQNFSSVLKSKQKILNSYNILFQVIKMIDLNTIKLKKSVTLIPEKRTFFDKIILRYKWLK